ncbi:MAG: DUF2953 domain-containing protein [bacterium]
MFIGIAICFACLVILLLVVPVQIIFSLEGFPSFKRHISVCLLFGLIRLPVPSRSAKSPLRRKARRKEPRAKRSQRRVRHVIKLLKSKGLFRRLLRFISDIYKAVSIRISGLHCIFGLDDPADTGMLWAVVGPVSSILDNLYMHGLYIEPDFINETFYIEGKGEISMVPIRILYIVTIFLLSPAVIRAGWAMMRTRRV